MNTQCNQAELEFQGLGRKKVIVKNDGERSSTDAGLLLLREIEAKRKIIKRFSRCFSDKRKQRLVRHKLEDILKQRVFGICQGYEDINDHEQWRHDPMLAVSCDREPGTILAGKSTLNRMELPAVTDKDSRYKKITYNREDIRELFIKLALESHKKEPQEIIIDLDATNDPLHGKQEGRFFQGYYDEYCYLPLYAFVGEHLLLADLMTADSDPGLCAVGPVRFLIYTIREYWPDVHIILRADSGFCREGIMSFCESLDKVDYVLGLAGNSRLKRALGRNIEIAKKRYLKSGEKQRIFQDIEYKTKKSWARSRRVVGKAEYQTLGGNARFVVTSLGKKQYPAQELYENLYCGRGDMENRIKEQKLFLFSDRTSTHYLRSNQLRLWFSSLAYVFCIILRQSLSSTYLEKSRVDTIRLKLLKVSAMVRVSFRRVYIRFPESFPYWDIWIVMHKTLGTT